ncbi:MAG: HNH endonuclease [Spirochaetes bacterium]|nr:HNH endonuclease [Spirochaetota bacterium]
MRGQYCVRHASLQVEKDRKHREWATARWDAHHDKIDYKWVWHDPRWRRLRAIQLRKEPNCRRCGQRAMTVDHINPHRGDVGLAFDPDNLQSLCDRCSAIKSREDRDIVQTHTPPLKKKSSKDEPQMSYLLCKMAILHILGGVLSHVAPP